MTNNDTTYANVMTDDEVRDAYATVVDSETGEEWASPRLEAEFDAWIAAHDARVKAEAWDEGYWEGQSDAPYGFVTNNRYKQ